MLLRSLIDIKISKECLFPIKARGTGYSNAAMKGMHFATSLSNNEKYVFQPCFLKFESQRIEDGVKAKIY